MTIELKAGGRSYGNIYNKVYSALVNDTEGVVPHEEVHKAAQGITAALWELYMLIAKENLPETGNVVIDSVLEMFQ